MLTADERRKLRERVDAEAARKYHVGLSLPHATVRALLDAYDALEELVACKELKGLIMTKYTPEEDADLSEGFEVELTPELLAQIADYERRKPLAWDRASLLIRGEK